MMYTPQYYCGHIVQHHTVLGRHHIFDNIIATNCYSTDECMFLVYQTAQQKCKAELQQNHQDKKKESPTEPEVQLYQ